MLAFMVFADKADAKTDGIKLVVVGGGAGGVELALSMQARLRRELRARGRSTDLVKVSLIAKSKVVMPAHNKQVRAPVCSGSDFTHDAFYEHEHCLGLLFEGCTQARAVSYRSPTAYS
jgi:hypothetical protein